MRTIGYIMAGLVLASCAAHYRPLGELREEVRRPSQATNTGRRDDTTSRDRKNG